MDFLKEFVSTLRQKISTVPPFFSFSNLTHDIFQKQGLKYGQKAFWNFTLFPPPWLLNTLQWQENITTCSSWRLWCSCTTKGKWQGDVRYQTPSSVQGGAASHFSRILMLKLLTQNTRAAAKWGSPSPLWNWCEGAIKRPFHCTGNAATLKV